MTLLLCALLSAAGERVKVFRLVTALNPVTQARVEDRFLVAEIEIAEAGEVLSRARPAPEVARLIRVGDRVELASQTVAAIEPLPSAKACAPEPTQPNPEADAFLDAFKRAQELPPQGRAGFWERWSGEHGSWLVSKSVAAGVAGGGDRDGQGAADRAPPCRRRAYLALPPTDTTPDLRREAELWVRSLEKSQ